MKIALSSIAWGRHEDEAVATLMQHYGVTGLDVAPTRLATDPLALSKADLTAYANFWHGYGVQLVGMQSLLYGHPELTIFTSEADRQQTTAYLKAIIQLAGKLGLGPLVFGSPKNRQLGELTPDAALNIAAEFFTDLGQYAHTHNTIFCLEPNPVQYGCDFITTTLEALDLVQLVNHPGFRLHLDSAIMTLNDEAIELSLDEAMAWLVHFHISEPQLGVVKAGGAVDHRRFADHLHTLGYDHWVSIEMRGGWTSPDATSVAEALAFVTEIYS